MTTRILIADDHPIVRHGLRSLIEAQSGLTVVGEVSDHRSAIRQASEANVDLLLLDMNMPKGSMLTTLEQLRAVRPTLRVLILSVHPEDQIAIRALRAGAAGYLTKDRAPEELVSAIERVRSGRRYVGPRLAERLAERLDDDADLEPHAALSDRELQVLRGLAGGEESSDLAARLGLSVKTVSTYRRRVLDKLRLSNNVELTHYAIAHGLVD